MHKTNVPPLKKNKPRIKTSRKIIILLVVLFVVILGILFFRSSLSKISSISFTGSSYSTDEELLKQSGLKVGDSFFGTSAATIQSRLSSLPAVENVLVDKHFPGKIEVTIQEYPSVAYALSGNGKLLAYLPNGKQVVAKGGISIERPLLSGWKSDDINLLKLCKALSKMSSDLTADFSEILPTPTLSFPDRIRLYTRSGFEVITSVSLLPEKAEYLSGVIETQEPGLITMLEADTYKPFHPAVNDEESEKDTTHD